MTEMEYGLLPKGAFVVRKCGALMVVEEVRVSRAGSKIYHLEIIRHSDVTKRVLGDGSAEWEISIYDAHNFKIVQGNRSGGAE